MPSRELSAAVAERFRILLQLDDQVQRLTKLWQQGYEDALVNRPQASVRNVYYLAGYIVGKNERMRE